MLISKVFQEIANNLSEDFYNSGTDGNMAKGTVKLGDEIQMPKRREKKKSQCC